MDYQNNRFYAAVAVALLALLIAGYYGFYGFFEDVGSYEVPTDQLTYKLDRAESTVVPAGAALDALVPEMTDERDYNPFSLVRQLHSQESGDVDFPPPPPLASPLPAPLPFEGTEH